MSAEKRRKIANAALKYKYRPRRPRRGRLAGVKVGYEIPRVWSSDERVNPIFGMQTLALVSAVERLDGELSPFTVDPAIANFKDGEGTNKREGTVGSLVAHQAWLREYATAIAVESYREVARLRRLKAFFIDDPRDFDARIEGMLADHVPFVVIGRPYPPGPYFCADIDDVSGFEQMCRELQKIGCHQIGHFGFSDDTTQVPRRRRQAIRTALQGELVDTYPKHYENHDDDDTVVKLVNWLRKNPKMEAVVCDSDDYAALLARAVPLAERRVTRVLTAPEDLILAGCDDAPVRIASPVRWMTLRQPAAEWADAAATLLAESLDGGQPRTIRVPPQVVDGYQGTP
jgi:DNA-binding LacI/PurR family transcriptional regulator